MLACKPMAASVEVGVLLHLLEEDGSQEQAGHAPFLAILVEELFIRCESFLCTGVPSVTIRFLFGSRSNDSARLANH